MNKKAGAVFAVIVFIIFEGFLIFVGPNIWGSDQAYHIWGKTNTLVFIGMAIISVIFSMFRKNKKSDGSGEETKSESGGK